MKRVSRFKEAETVVENSTTITTGNQHRKLFSSPLVVAKDSLGSRAKFYWATLPPPFSYRRIGLTYDIFQIELSRLESELEQSESPITTVLVERHISSSSTYARLRQPSVSGNNSKQFDLQYELDNEEESDTQLDYRDVKQFSCVEIKPGINWKNFSSTKKDSSKLFNIQYELDVEEEE